MNKSQKPITLQQFYNEFLKFVKGNEKRWEKNEKQLKRIEKKLDYSVDYLDNQILSDHKRITKLEQVTIH